MGQPAEDEMERSPRVAAKHLEDVVLHGKSMKAPGTYTNTVATAYYQHFMKWLKDMREGQKQATKASAEARKCKKVAREKLWREMTEVQLKEHFEWDTKDIVKYIQNQGDDKKSQTIARIVAPLVKKHRKDQLNA